jgi:serine protease Do
MKNYKAILVSIVSGMFGTVLFFSLLFFIIQSKNKSSFLPPQEEVLPIMRTNLLDFQTFATSTDLTYAASVSVPAVVHIKTQFMRRNYHDDFFSPFFDFFGYSTPREYPVAGAGSGVIISSDGYVVTNNHVINQAELIIVTLDDKREFEAKLIGKDASTDLALLKIDSSDLPFLSFGDSDELQIGEWVLAVGNPFNLNSTVTAGIVSAKARNINILGGGNSIESFIQTDAAVNKGNSGGALVNQKGQLIGINTAIASRTGYYTGYSFAIPSKIVKKVVEDFILFGEIQRAYIGISAIEITAQFAREYNINDVKGLYVARVEPQSGAADAGIKQGDIILAINNAEVNSSARLVEIISKYRPGDKLDVIVKTNNREKKVTVVLKDNTGSVTAQNLNESTNRFSILGATFELVSQNELQKLKITNGIKITKLENGKLRQAGIQEGFIITQIDGTPIRTISDVRNALDRKTGGVLIEGVYPNGMKAYYGFGL